MQNYLESGSNHAFDQITAQEMPVAFVVREQDLASLRSFKDTIVDRKKKHPGKELAKYLLGKKPKIPLIIGNHFTSGRLSSSIRALLKNALQFARPGVRSR